MDLTPSQPPEPDGGPADGRPPQHQPHPEQAHQPSQDGPAHEQAQAAQAAQATQSAQSGQAAVQKLPSATGVTRTGKEIGGKKFRVGAGDEYVPFRSRTKRRRRMITAGVVVLLLIGAGAYGVVSLTGSPSSEAKAASGCPASGTSGTGKAAAGASGSQDAVHVAVAANGKLPAANQITLNVYNATERQGLAHGVANQLKQRGFKVGQIINDPLKATVTAAAQIRAGASGASAMRVVAAEVAGAQLRPDTRPDSSVDLVLGSGFNALASPDQVSAALKAITDAAKAAAAKNACS